MSAAARGQDLRTLYVLQGLRAFVYGFGSVIIGASFAAASLSGLQVGMLFAAMLAGSGFLTLGLARRAELLGRKRVYLWMYGLMGLAGTVFALSSNYWVLVLAALTGTISIEVVESGPFTSVEQAMIPQVAGERTTHVFGVYNAIASLVGAAGALAAGGPETLRHVTGSAPADQTWLLVYPVVAIAALLIGRRLTVAVEAHPTERRHVPLTVARRPVHRMAALFAVDSFAGGFIVQSFIVYWFTEKFQAPIQLMAMVLAATGVIQAFSFLIATRLARRFGLLNTMVFTHLPSNFLLMLIPLAPTLTLAWILFLIRFPLSQMDVPTRQAYLAALVPEEERAAAASVTNAARTLIRPFAAPFAGWAVSAGYLGLPFYVAGGMKAAYDLALYAWFRKIPIDEPARHRREARVAPAPPSSPEPPG